MSSDWSFRLLLTPGGLVAGRVIDLWQRATGLGFDVLRDEDGAVLAMNVDGTGSLTFATPEAALEFLCLGGVTLVRSGAETFVSLAPRATGVLGEDLTGVDDDHLFDELAIAVPARYFSKEGREALWKSVEQLLTSCVDALNPVFGFGLDEDSVEALWPFLCVHRRIASGRLPPFVPWFMLAATSALRGQAGLAAQACGGSVKDDGSAFRLQLTEYPWDATPATLRNASERWRETAGDRGCEAP